jgi:hypothetical protein
MNDCTSFSLRHNAKRAAERMIEGGTAPSIDYGLREREDGRFEIVWRCGAEAVDQRAEPPETEIEPEVEAEPTVEAETDPWPGGTRVAVAISKRRTRTGTVDYRVDDTHWRVILDGAAAGISNLYSGSQLAPTGAAAPDPKATKPERRAPSPADRKPSRYSELDAAAARGVMPEKPIVTSKANLHYQKRFDRLADLAAAGDWDGVRDYAATGSNSYAKMLRQYKDRLLAAYEAKPQAEAA